MRHIGYWRAEASAVLEFVAILDGVEVKGVDIIGWNADDRIVGFEVMARPSKVMEFLRAKMAERLEAMRNGEEIVPPLARRDWVSATRRRERLSWNRYIKAVGRRLRPFD